MGDDLGVGLAGELRAHVAQAALERDVVLDDAVDDHVDAVRGVEVRVRVVLRDAAVRGPARVPDARGGGLRGAGDAARLVGRVDGRDEVVEVAHGPHGRDLAVGEHGDARGVVAAVLELAQAGEEDLLDGPRSDVSDDAAHGGSV